MVAFPPGLPFWRHPQNLHIYSAIQAQSRQRHMRHRLVNRCGSNARAGRNTLAARASVPYPCALAPEGGTFG